MSCVPAIEMKVAANRLLLVPTPVLASNIISSDMKGKSEPSARDQNQSPGVAENATQGVDTILPVVKSTENIIKPKPLTDLNETDIANEIKQSPLAMPSVKSQLMSPLRVSAFPNKPSLLEKQLGSPTKVPLVGEVKHVMEREEEVKIEDQISPAFTNKVNNDIGGDCVDMDMYNGASVPNSTPSQLTLIAKSVLSSADKSRLPQPVRLQKPAGGEPALADKDAKMHRHPQTFTSTLTYRKPQPEEAKFAGIGDYSSETEGNKDSTMDKSGLLTKQGNLGKQEHRLEQAMKDEVKLGSLDNAWKKSKCDIDAVFGPKEKLIKGRKQRKTSSASVSSTSSVSYAAPQDAIGHSGYSAEGEDKKAIFSSLLIIREDTFH